MHTQKREKELCMQGSRLQKAEGKTSGMQEWMQC